MKGHGPRQSRYSAKRLMAAPWLWGIYFFVQKYDLSGLRAQVWAPSTLPHSRVAVGASARPLLRRVGRKGGVRLTQRPLISSLARRKSEVVAVRARAQTLTMTATHFPVVAHGCEWFRWFTVVEASKPFSCFSATVRRINMTIMFHISHIKGSALMSNLS